MQAQDFRSEMERIRRVSDMLVTGHANLRDRYQRRATFLDLTILAFSLWLTAVVFVEPRINTKLTPFGMDPQIWVGLLGIFTFFLSIVQLRVDWKGRSDAHKRAFDLYSEVKRECGYLLVSQAVLTADNCQRVLSRYDMATDVGVVLPETEFLAQKQKHLRKIAISRHLDKHPSASLLLLKIKFWWHDNCRGTEKSSDKHA
ncbi:MAG TPA: hypothetical protein VLK33_12475 [Terriglobales bacterium]|nr:hypothetical protein [Terriglobales bacterium]